MKKIAVIGAGVFGCEISIQLAKRGFQVTLIEKERDILLGATSRSVLRLHLGFHYPRDLDTAIQSRLGYRRFLERFPASIDLNFDNFYALAKVGSRVNQLQFLRFSQAAGLQMSQVPLDTPALSNFATDRVQSVYCNKEGVINVENLRKQFLQEMNEFRVEKRFNSEILKVCLISGKWITTDYNNMELDFDFVVRATYGHDRIKFLRAGGGLFSRKFEFQHTLVLDVDVKISRIGMTVIDGDFLTVLPKANQEGHLIYAPAPSVMGRYVGEEYPPSWDSIADGMISMSESAIKNRFKEWFKSDDPVTVRNRLVTIRAIDSEVKETDRRVSQVYMRAKHFIDVNSGKIDHCVGIATDVVDIVSNCLGHSEKVF